MKKLIYSISILLFAVIFCNAQWVTNGPNDVINSLAGVGTYTIAGGNSGVYISTNNGGTWTIGGSLPGIVQVIAICNSYIYAGLSGQGLYRSTGFRYPKASGFPIGSQGHDSIRSIPARHHLSCPGGAGSCLH